MQTEQPNAIKPEQTCHWTAQSTCHEPELLGGLSKRKGHMLADCWAHLCSCSQHPSCQHDCGGCAGIIAALVVGILLVAVLLGVLRSSSKSLTTARSELQNFAELSELVNRHTSHEGSVNPQQQQRSPAISTTSGYTFGALGVYATHSSSERSSQKHSTSTSGLSRESKYFTPKALTNEEATPLMWQTLQPNLQMHYIHAPLWQDVEIQPDMVSIVQTAEGKGWILGEGSYGMVCLCQRASQNCLCYYAVSLDVALEAHVCTAVHTVLPCP